MDVLSTIIGLILRWYIIITERVILTIAYRNSVAEIFDVSIVYIQREEYNFPICIIIYLFMYNNVETRRAIFLHLQTLGFISRMDGNSVTTWLEKWMRLAENIWWKKTFWFHWLSILDCENSEIGIGLWEQCLDRFDTLARDAWS